MRPIEIHGYAIVSDNDMIADDADQVPMSLRNPVDWEQYQAAQARSALVVFARVSHQNEPNTRGDRRLVVTRSVAGLEQRDDAWWWNPAATGWDEVAAKLLPDGGEVAACGGQGVFDLFLGDYHVSICAGARRHLARRTQDLLRLRGRRNGRGGAEAARAASRRDDRA